MHIRNTAAIFFANDVQLLKITIYFILRVAELVSHNFAEREPQCDPAPILLASMFRFEKLHYMYTGFETVFVPELFI
jgi:hypothetical protein